ncbi:phage major capsid protein [Dyella sp. GSA-30]|uniref:phage major capsid protein n=1 Tax=Dyella sp. GSA-30 TaxID=2994496 RepID=UPI002490B558|nr:phage major capsid protein [Dyella sp. GSA-30]BDU22037.1 hypothetical protein DYGSA30_34940 [Dyella sp. GSA-30]
MNRTTSKQIPRGLQTVRAEADELPALIRGLNASFADFKAKHNQEVRELQSAVDALAIRNASVEMHGGGSQDAPVEPVHAAVGLRGTKAIAEHFKSRAKAKGENNAVSLADMVRGIAGMQTTEAAMASLSRGTDANGGYAVPNIVMPGILDALAEQSSLLRAGASILPLDEGAKTITTAAIDTLPTPSWRQELGNVAESGPTFRAVVQTPQSLACIVRISRELLADAADMDRALRTAISQAFAAELDRVGLVGSGVAPEPLGIMGTAGVNTIAQAGAAFAYGDLLKAYQASLDHRAPVPTSAILAPRTLIELAGLADTLGQPLNRPVLLNDVSLLPTTGVPVNLGDADNESLAFVGDFRVVQFGMREALSIQLLREAYSKTGEIGFLCHLRADVAVNYPSALTVITGVK